MTSLSSFSPCGRRWIAPLGARRKRGREVVNGKFPSDPSPALRAPSPAGGEGWVDKGDRRLLAIGLANTTPHPALRATFSRKGRRVKEEKEEKGEGSGGRGTG